MRRGVLVIGNGFDLDLGLKTSFNDIFNGWDPNLDVKISSLYDLVCGETGNQWNLLEDNIRSLYPDAISSFGPITSDMDEKCHQEMIFKITSYLKEMDKSVNNQSYAYKLIHSIHQNNKFSIYSFNYTDSVERFIDQDVCHVHGKIEDNSVILGTEDNENADRKLCFLQKSFSPFYKSNDLKCALNNSDTVIFFGHSLGKADYLYFQEFFKKQSEDGLSEKSRKKIVIITYDEESRRDIIFQLFSMNNNRLDLFYQQNDFEVILTCKEDFLHEKYERRFAELLSYLKENSVSNDQTKLANLATSFR